MSDNTQPPYPYPSLAWDDPRYYRIEVVMWYLSPKRKIETYFNEYVLASIFHKDDEECSRWRRFIAQRVDHEIMTHLLNRDELYGSLLGPRMVVEYKGNEVIKISGIELPYELSQTKDQVMWAYRHAALLHFKRVSELHIYVPNVGEVNDPIWGQIEEFGPGVTRLDV